MAKTFSWKKFQIQYETWGDPAHQGLLFFHGFPGSHIQAQALAPYLDQYKLHVVSADRPGYGGTSSSLAAEDFLHGLAALLKKEKIEEVVLVGVSGGAPWAHWMTSFVRARSLGIVCGLASMNEETKQDFSPFQRRGLHWSGRVPTRITTPALDFLFKALAPEKRIATLQKLVDPRDRGLLGDQAVRMMVLASMAQARAQGVKGMINDMSLYRKDWLRTHCDSYALSQVPIHYFHGKKDKILSYRMSENMHRAHSHSTLQLLENEGHYSLALRQIPLILDTALGKV